MGTGITFLIIGLLCILLPRTQWYKDNIEKHNYTESEDFIQPIRNIIGWVCVAVGIIIILFGHAFLK